MIIQDEASLCLSSGIAVRKMILIARNRVVG